MLKKALKEEHKNSVMPAYDLPWGGPKRGLLRLILGGGEKVEFNGLVVSELNIRVR